MTVRNTKQRTAVRAALREQPTFVSAQQLHAVMRESGSTVGLATVYRALATMAENEEADVIQTADGEALYRACTPGRHHHHLVCRSCGLTIELESGAVEAWASSVSREHGFTATEHVIDVFGICPTCAARAASSTR